MLRFKTNKRKGFVLQHLNICLCQSMLLSFSQFQLEFNKKETIQQAKECWRDDEKEKANLKNTRPGRAGSRDQHLLLEIPQHLRVLQSSWGCPTLPHRAGASHARLPPPHYLRGQEKMNEEVLYSSCTFQFFPLGTWSKAAPRHPVAHLGRWQILSSKDALQTPELMLVTSQAIKTALWKYSGALCPCRPNPFRTAQLSGICVLHDFVCPQT